MALSPEEVVEQVLPKTLRDHGLIALRKAVDETLDLRRAISSFRDRRLRWRETGIVADLVQSWYRRKFEPSSFDGYPTRLVERNPYAKFKEENPNASLPVIYSKLDVLLDEIPVGIPSHSFCFRDDESVVRELDSALSLGKLDSLIQPSPYLRHDENAAIAVMDVRLWLSYSPLPVVLGRQESYADMRTRPVTAVVRDNKPSTFHVLLKELAVYQYWNKQEMPALNLYHPAPDDFSEQDSYWARLSRVRFPHQSFSAVSASEFAADLSACLVDEEETLEEWESTETRSMYRLLSEYIFGKPVLF